jgi:hypothetical protein
VPLVIDLASRRQSFSIACNPRSGSRNPRSNCTRVELPLPEGPSSYWRNKIGLRWRRVEQRPSILLSQHWGHEPGDSLLRAPLIQAAQICMDMFIAAGGPGPLMNLDDQRNELRFSIGMPGSRSHAVLISSDQTQLPRVSWLIPRFLATSAIDTSVVRTNRTASCQNSSAHFEWRLIGRRFL